jgi:hypothetical protein
LPLSFILANAGWVHCLEKLSGGLRTRLQQGFVIAASCYAFWLISTNAIAHYEDTGTSPDAAAVATYLKPIMRNGDKVDASIPTNYPLFFYLWYQDVRDFRAEKTSDAEFVVLERDRFPSPPGQDESLVKLADVGDLTVFRSAPGIDESTTTPAAKDDEE